MKWSWWSAQMRHDATSTTCWMTERSWPKRSATSNSRWMQGSDPLQKSGWDVNSLLFSTLTFRTSGHPVHKQIDMLQRINPFAFCCPFLQRRTLIISELESQGALEAPLAKQVENLETEMGLRWVWQSSSALVWNSSENVSHYATQQLMACLYCLTTVCALNSGQCELLQFIRNIYR